MSGQAGPDNAVNGPVRMCMVCRNRLAKKDLLRLVMDQDSADADKAGLVEDNKQVKPGRGWYVCPDSRCREKIKGQSAWRHKARGKR